MTRTNKKGGVNLGKFTMDGPEAEEIVAFAALRKWSVGDALRVYATIGAWVMSMMPQMMVATVMAKFSQEEK